MTPPLRPDPRLSIAPMMEYTDRHYRALMRFYTKRTLLYTEMVVGSTLTYNRGDRGLLERALGFDPSEHPLAVQLGGDDPAVLKQAARLCEDWGYDEINLNVGCPSDRVQKGRFGACLMKTPELVGELLAAMRSVVRIPVTVKHRIGVDDQDRYEDLHRFVEIVAESGVETFIVHARKAWLKGLSPAQNRNVPPLRYEDVYLLKKAFPALTIVINGGVTSLQEAADHLAHVDGVMMGRAAYRDPGMFAQADSLIFGAPAQPAIHDEDLLEAWTAYTRTRLQAGDRLSFLLKHLVGLFKGRKGSRLWRRLLSDLIQQKPQSIDLAELYRKCFSHDGGV